MTTVSYVIRMVEESQAMLAERIRSVDGLTDTTVLGMVEHSAAWVGTEADVRSEMTALKETCETDCPLELKWETTASGGFHTLMFAGPVVLEGAT